MSERRLDKLFRLEEARAIGAGSRAMMSVENYMEALREMRHTAALKIAFAVGFVGLILLLGNSP